LVRPRIPAAGEIWWLNMSPSAGREQRDRHAGLVLSDWQFNRSTGFCYLAPITTVGNASRGNGFAVQLTGAGTATAGVAQLDQVRSFDYRARDAEKSGDKVPDALLNEALARFAAIFGLELPDDVDGGGE
jgi:mRNA interferase MazF/mRNA interferase ChpB